MSKPDEIKEAVKQATIDYHERFLWICEFLFEGDDETAERLAKASERICEQVRERAGKKRSQRSLRPILEASRRRVCG